MAEKYSDALDLTVTTYDLDGHVTMRGYFKSLLGRLLQEGEGFSGKRPFGNSGWEYDLYKPLVEAGLVKGEIEDGELGEFDQAAADKFLAAMVEAL